MINHELGMRQAFKADMVYRRGPDLLKEKARGLGGPRIGCLGDDVANAQKGFQVALGVTFR